MTRDKARRSAQSRTYRAKKKNDPAWVEKRRAEGSAYWKANREKVQFNTARYQAKKRGLAFTIQFSEITWPEFCPVFGRRLVREGRGSHTNWSPSLDRIDSTKGYVPGNVIVVSMRANRIKSDATVAELERLVEFYKGLG